MEQTIATHEESVADAPRVGELNGRRPSPGRSAEGAARLRGPRAPRVHSERRGEHPPPPVRLTAGVSRRLGTEGSSKLMTAVHATIAQAAAVSSNVLVTGEPGTGKEVAARAIHDNSERRDGAFIAARCAAMDSEQATEELFGRESIDAEGNTRTRRGLLELAQGGTLFLHEIGGLPRKAQLRLGRALLEGSFQRIGGGERLRVDVRVIASSSRDLRPLVGRGELREDLYYKLCRLPLHIPALRDRLEDVPALARSFFARYRETTNARVRELSEDAINALALYHWPGNVRELEALIEQLVTLHGGDARIELWHLPRYLQEVESPEPFDITSLYGKVALDDAVDRLQSALIERALTETGGNYSRAAEILRTTRRIIKYNADRLGIQVDGRRP